MNTSDVIVILDAGHGLNTAGKRTPVFPDGSQMRESQFNYDVASRIKSLLGYIGIQVELTSPDINIDVPLSERVDKANAVKAKYPNKKVIFISLHANAFGDGVTFNDAQGWDIFCYQLGGQAEVIAKNIKTHSHPFLGVVDRGIKTANFYVIKNTTMPAILIEHAFMTNLNDATKLKDPAFRQKCAIATSKGICSYFGIVYKEKPITQPTTPTPAPSKINYETELVRIYAGTEKIVSVTGYSRALEVAKTDERFIGKQVILACVTDNKTWNLGVVQTMLAPVKQIKQSVTPVVKPEAHKSPIVEQKNVEAPTPVAETKEVKIEQPENKDEEILNKLNTIEAMLVGIKELIVSLVDLVKKFIK